MPCFRQACVLTARLRQTSGPVIVCGCRVAPCCPDMSWPRAKPQRPVRRAPAKLDLPPGCRRRTGCACAPERCGATGYLTPAPGGRRAGGPGGAAAAAGGGRRGGRALRRAEPGGGQPFCSAGLAEPLARSGLPVAAARVCGGAPHCSAPARLALCRLAAGTVSSHAPPMLRKAATIVRSAAMHARRSSLLHACECVARQPGMGGLWDWARSL